ncbi:hypothetical protein M0805_001325 [Coniferiporia weirii]|nr:hypothetical protein M0805_001325 [Coniferiporia weirii]
MASAPTKALSSVRRGSAPRVLLASRAVVDKHEAGLMAVEGAREIIEAIKARKSVKKLILGHNSLGDDGCRELFRFLCTEGGRRYRIAEISLNSNGIGDRGLEAIAEYLVGNEHLKELFLQNNEFQGDEDVAFKLSSAINSSRLEVLSLVTNQRLFNTFFSIFVSHLDPPALRELHVSSLGLTQAAAPVLVSYLTSPRSRTLETLKCNGNSLGRHAVRAVVAALRKSNFTLQKLEVYANLLEFLNLGDGDADTDADNVGASDSSLVPWETVEQDLKNLLLRNEMLRQRTHEEALLLLSYSRMLLLDPPRRSHDPSQETSDPRTSSKSTFSASAFPFRALPTELQHHVLSFLAPTLSTAQRVRVFSFASSPATLRPLLPRLGSGANADVSGAVGAHAGCIPDPASLPFGMGGIDPGPGLDINAGMGTGIGPGVGPGTGMESWLVAAPRVRLCAGGRCMGANGSVLCHRNEVRARWLGEVGCTRFEAEGRTEADVLQLL